MKIKVFFVHPSNYGNMMMVASYIYNSYMIFTNEYKISPIFYLDVLDQEELKMVKKSLPQNINVKGEFIYNKKRRGIIGKIQKLVNVPYEIHYNKMHYDACIILGGDCISQYYSKQKFVFNQIIFHFVSKKIPTYALGQTMGPFSGLYKNLIKWGMKYCNIFTREKANYLYLKNEFGFKRLHEARDLAVLDIPFQNDCDMAKNVLRKYVGDKKYVTYVPSGANLQYTSKEDEYINEFVQMIENTLYKTDYDVVLLAHVIHTENSNDKKIIDKIYPKISAEYKNRIKIVNYLINPYEARIILGNGEYTITGRMHAAVSSINMNVMPICLSYSVKYKGVIGDVYGFNDFIIQCRGNEYWNGYKINKKVAELESRLIDNKSDYCEMIKAKNEDVKRMAMQQISSSVHEIMKQVYGKKVDRY